MSVTSETRPRRLMHPRAEKQIRAVLARMSLGSIRRLRHEIHQGHIDGGCYGSSDNFAPPGRSEPPYPCCFLGWAGFLEHVRLVELFEWGGMQYRHQGRTALELFVLRIKPGDVPLTSLYSMELWNLVTDVMVEREQAPDPDPDPEPEQAPELA